MDFFASFFPFQSARHLFRYRRNFYEISNYINSNNLENVQFKTNKQTSDTGVRFVCFNLYLILGKVLVTPVFALGLQLLTFFHDQ